MLFKVPYWRHARHSSKKIQNISFNLKNTCSKAFPKDIFLENKGHEAYNLLMSIDFVLIPAQLLDDRIQFISLLSRDIL